jgi:CBS domain-containing protein
MVKDVDTLPAAMPVDEAVAFFTSGERRRKSCPIIGDDNRLVGMATRADILRWRAESPRATRHPMDMKSAGKREYDGKTMATTGAGPAVLIQSSAM